jgi:hypothetical protein
MGWQSYVAICDDSEQEAKVLKAIDDHAYQKQFVGGELVEIQKWKMTDGRVCYIFANDCGRGSTFKYFKDNDVELEWYDTFDCDNLKKRLEFIQYLNWLKVNNKKRDGV